MLCFAGPAVMFALVALPLTASPVRAGETVPPPHLALKRSDPPNDGRLTVSPPRLSLWFTAKPELAFSRITLTGPDGPVALEPLTADTGNALHARIAQPLDAGEYVVHWQSGSADGHPIRGDIPFVVLSAASPVVARRPTADANVTTRAADPSSDTSPSRTARWLEFAALLTVLGVLGFRHGVLPPLAVRGVSTADAANRARRIGLAMLLVYAIAAVMRLYLQTAMLAGRELGLDAGALTRVITGTTWGAGWSAGVVGAALVAIGWVASKRSVAIGTPLALTGALGMVLSPALSGHAASSPNFVVSITLDTLHVAAAGLWIGGLAIVLFAGIPAMLRFTDGNPHAAVSALVNSFHPLALLCAPLAVLTGLGTSWLRVGAPGVAWVAPYSRILLLKMGCVLLVVAMGAYNSLRVRRGLGASDGAGTRWFRRTGSAELAFGMLVIAVTTFLVVTPVPSETGSP